MAALIIFFLAGILYFYLSVVKYFNYSAYAFDLGIYTQASWLISHFQMPISTIRGINQFGDHFSPIYILLSLGYRFFESPVYLLSVQLLLVLLSGIPIYLIAKRELRQSAACFLTMAYFLQIGLVSAVRFDFHLATLSVFFVSWTLYFWHYNRFRPYFLFLVLAILTKEDVALIFSFFSFYLFFQKKVKMAVATLLVCQGWFWLDTKIIIPFFLEGDYGYWKINWNLLTVGWNVKTTTLLSTFGQTAGLSLSSPLGWFFALPHFLTRFLSSEVRWMTSWHYGANLAPALWLSTILAIKRMGTFNGAGLLVLTATILLGPTFASSWQNVPNRATLDKIVAKVPPDARISAQDAIVPHLANREKIYLFPNISDADYIILAPNLASFPLNHYQLDTKVDELKADNDLSLTFDQDNVLVFERRSKNGSKNPPRQ